MAKTKGPKQINLTQAEIKSLQERIKNKKMFNEDYLILEETLDFVLWLQAQLLYAKISLHNLKSLLFGSSLSKNTQGLHELQNTAGNGPEGQLAFSQTREDLIPEPEAATNEIPILKDPAGAPIAQEPNIEKKKGHGRISAAKYLPETIVTVKHEDLIAGGPCPTEYCDGKLYALAFTPGGLVRIQGRSCAHVISYEFHRLRCALCGITFTPKNPAGFSDEKYDEHFNAIMAAQKYFLATPFFRQESYCNMIGLPLSDATQWDCIKKLAVCVAPVLPALEKIAADCPNINHDDTHVKILSVIAENKKDPKKKRKGSYTTCIVARSEEHEIHIYYSGTAHGGENLNKLLKIRDPSLGPVKQMCDALAANTTSPFGTILSNCLSHATRKFKDLEVFFQDECNYALKRFRKVYENDECARKESLSDEERLVYHQSKSVVPMEELHLWMEEQINEKKIEKNSPLGKAIAYLRNHWSKLTRFLSVAGVDLDNNIVERALKLAIRTRKNAMFHKTERGAEIAALILSLIATSIKAKKNPIHYLTELQKNKVSVAFAPELWLPWNYEETLLNGLLEKVPRVD